LYVFIRHDLSPEQIAVQSCHAIVECGKAFDLKALPEHPSIIIFGIRNELKLQEIRKYLIAQEIQHVHFYEPDIGHELTALATQPVFGDQRAVFKKFQLLRISSP